MKKEIVFAGGCFWGVQEYFRRLRGVLDTKVGYAQGITMNTSYEEVCSGNTEHTEVCLIRYDNTILKLENLLNQLFRIIEPTQLNHQGGDYGTQYRTGIYYIDDEDRIIIEKYIQNEQKNHQQDIVVECEKLKNFHSAEEYHQDYLLKNIAGYCHVDFRKIKKEELK